VVQFPLQVGMTVPTPALRRTLETAVRDARTGRSTFASVWEVDVLFTVRPGGTDVCVRGLSKDSPESELRLVGDNSFRLLNASEREQTSNDLSSISPTDRYLVEMAGDATEVGTPLGLITAIPDGDAVAVARSDGATTLRLPLPYGAICRSWGDLTPDPMQGPVRQTLWTVTDSGLVDSVRDEQLPFVIRFFDWGSAPEVTAPPENQVEDEVAYLLRTMPRRPPLS
jgi:hypothetical protein